MHLVQNDMTRKIVIEHTKKVHQKTKVSNNISIKLCRNIVQNQINERVIPIIY